MIKEIQYLRGIAASMVVLYHTIPQLKRMGYTGPEFEFLSYGVDIFFIISGFIMTYISINTTTSRWGFIKNRIIRIAPIYWALTTFVALLGITFPSLLQSTQVSLDQYIKSIFFIPYIHPISRGYFPLLQPGWTLNYEMYFYLVFATFLGLKSDKKYFTMIIMLSIATISFGQLAGNTTLEFYGSPIIMEFCLGILLGYTYVRQENIFKTPYPLQIGIAITFLGFILLFYSRNLLPHADRFFVAGIPSILIVGGSLSLAHAPERLESRMLEKIGDSSYSLYLSHVILLSALGQLFRKTIFPTIGEVTYIVFPVVALLTALACGYAFYCLAERTLTRQLRKRYG